MDCKTSSDLMMKNIEEDIDFIQQAHLLEHIGSCRACQEEYQLILELKDMMGQLPLMEPSAEFEDKIMNAIDLELYREKVEKRRILQPLIMSIGIYLTILFGFTMRIEFSYEEWLAVPSFIQHLALLGRVVEKLLGRIMLMAAYTRELYQFIFSMLLKLTSGNILIYSLSLLLLTSLLLIINTTINKIIRD